MAELPDQSRVVLRWSGSLGFVLGALFADWQVVVETGQVLAGLVSYPPDNPFFLYHATVWSLLNQGAAVMLRAGASEIASSVIVSGLLGLVSFQALSIVAYTFNRDARLAIGVPFVVFLSRATNFGVVYPVWLLATEHTYGVIGLGWVVLVAGLFAAGRAKLAGFLLGVAPAIHPSLGLFLGLLIAITAVWDRQMARAAIRSGRWPFLAGCAVTLASLAIHAAMMPASPELDSASAARFLTAFVALWDPHRGAVNFRSTGIAVVAGIMLVALVALTRSARLTPGQRFLLRFVLVTAVASLGLAWLTHLPAASTPPALLVLMPARVLNVDIFIAAALLLGLCHRRSRLAQTMMVALTALLVFRSRSMVWLVFDPDVTRGLAAVSVAAALAVALVARHRGIDVARAITMTLMAAAFGLASYLAADRLLTHGHALLRDRTNEPVFERASRGSGVLVTGGDLHLIQLRTRRPVLLDGGGMDALPYVLAAAPATAAILRDVYGIDFFNPPREGRGQGRIPSEPNRLVWEGYSAARWSEIALTHGVTEVLSPAGWTLQLPVVATGHGVTLHAIPRR